jgi:Mor family transcriptional regulator
MSARDDAALTLLWGMSKVIRDEAPFLNEQYSERLAGAVLEYLQIEFGGERLYIPAPSKTKRDEAIRREFNGRNRDEILKKYRISERRFYEIIGRRD